MKAVFDAVAGGIARLSFWTVFTLADAAVAHAALGGGQSAGAILLRP